MTSLLAAVLKERTRPDSLPGLEAMMPVSPLAKMLNRRDVTSDADLHVLGGDLAIGGFWSALKAIATDIYYLEDHDLVVNTRSMLRGLSRSGGVKYWIDTGGEVSHFNYFMRGDTASRLCDALTLERDSDFHALTVQPYDVTKTSYRKRAPIPQPTVFVIPGFMGSHLSVMGRVWANSAELSKGRLGLLADGSDVVAESLVGTYRDLIEHLSATHDVIPFAYDWRRSALDNAEILRERIEETLPIARAVEQPVRLLAHSSGGLLVQALLASEKGRLAWRSMCAHPGARAVLLGLPTGGSHRVAAMLTTRSTLIQGLAAIDLTRTDVDIQGVFAGFQGLLELLPDDERQDWFDRGWWERLETADTSGDETRRWHVPDGVRLKAARHVRDELRQALLDPSRMAYVAGAAEMTPSELRIGTNAAPGVGVFGTVAGDGHATWTAGIPEALRSRAYYTAAEHGALASSPELFPAIDDLLATGITTRLPATAPLASGGSDGGTPMTVRPIPMIPDDKELIASALGFDLRGEAAAAAPKVTVRVVHGNLSRATSPILIGHYEQDVFVSAEDSLDRQLDGRLRELHRMRLYPGPIGTSAVVVNDLDRRQAGVHPGAIVVGLGVVGELTPGSLLATIEQGLTAYGAERTGQERRRRQREQGAYDRSGDVVAAPITALLIGSGEGGVPLRDSVHAVLRAVHRANQRLALPESDRSGESSVTVSINAVELFELYEDRAIEALRVLTGVAQSAEFRDAFVVERILVRGSEGRQRASFEDQPAWWRRLRITEQDVSVDRANPSGIRVLKYEALTERARIDAYAVMGQRKQADVFINHVMASTAPAGSVGRTLFEMLIPNPLKEHAPDRRDTVLLLDAATASIPWELFEDGHDRSARPLAVESGMIRQLVEQYGRERVLQATMPTALVIGDPVVTDPRFPALAGAAREAATAVARLRAESYHVEDLILERATPAAVFAALHERSWRILHLAMHGVFNFQSTPESEPVTGVVLGADEYLQAHDFNQMRYDEPDPLPSRDGDAIAGRCGQRPALARAGGPRDRFEAVRPPSFGAQRDQRTDAHRAASGQPRGRGTNERQDGSSQRLERMPTVSPPR